MSAYVDAGYSVALATLAGYAVSIAVRERTARRRLPATAAGGADRGGGGPAGPSGATAAASPGGVAAPGGPVGAEEGAR